MTTNEAETVRSWTQGLLVGSFMNGLNGHLKVEGVETPIDEQGNYLHHFVVVTESGVRLRIEVEAE